MKQCIDSHKVHARLKKIQGKSAIHKVGQIILEGHLDHCVRDAINEGKADEAIERFSKAVSYFANLK